MCVRLQVAPYLHLKMEIKSNFRNVAFSGYKEFRTMINIYKTSDSVFRTIVRTYYILSEPYVRKDVG
jgi:hypothetical protein